PSLTTRRVRPMPGCGQWPDHRVCLKGKVNSQYQRSPTTLTLIQAIFLLMVSGTTVPPGSCARVSMEKYDLARGVAWNIRLQQFICPQPNIPAALTLKLPIQTPPKPENISLMPDRARI